MRSREGVAVTLAIAISTSPFVTALSRCKLVTGFNLTSLSNLFLSNSSELFVFDLINKSFANLCASSISNPCKFPLSSRNAKGGKLSLTATVI